MTDTEDIQLLPNELVYEPTVRTVDRHEVANHLAMYVLRQWRRTIPKVAFHPPDGYLEPICSMPVDIFYEILEYLHPIDLYHISHSNRALQTLLSHPNSGSAWALAFENDPAIPKCPPVTPEFPTKMSWFDWAALLFGKHICQQCGVGGAPPNVTFRHFRCPGCEVSLVNLMNQIIKGSDEIPLAKRSVVLHLSEDGDPMNTWDLWFVYSEAEVDAVQKAVTAYEDAIAREEPGAREAFDAYTAKRKADVDPIDEHSAACVRWAKQVQRCYDVELKGRNSNIMKKIRNRAKRVGYHPDDLREAFYGVKLFSNVSRLSNKRWETYKLLLEPAILQAKNKRLALYREMLIYERKDFARKQRNAFSHWSMSSSSSCGPLINSANDWN